MFIEANNSADPIGGSLDFSASQDHHRQTISQYRWLNNLNKTMAPVSEDGPSCMLFNVVSKKEKGDEKNRRHLNQKRDQLKNIIKQESAQKHSNF